MAAVLEPAEFADQTNRTILRGDVAAPGTRLTTRCDVVTGQLRDGGLYNVEDGVSAATLVEFSIVPVVSIPHYLDRVWKYPAVAM